MLRLKKTLNRSYYLHFEEFWQNAVLTLFSSSISLCPIPLYYTKCKNSRTLFQITGEVRCKMHQYKTSIYSTRTEVGDDNAEIKPQYSNVLHEQNLPRNCFKPSNIKEPEIFWLKASTPQLTTLDLPHSFFYSTEHWITTVCRFFNSRGKTHCLSCHYKSWLLTILECLLLKKAVLWHINMFIPVSFGQ